MARMKFGVVPPLFGLISQSHYYGSCDGCSKILSCPPSLLPKRLFNIFSRRHVMFYHKTTTKNILINKS